MGPWDRASWDPRDSRTLGHWDPGTLGPGLLGPQGPWDRASWDPRDTGTEPLGTPGTLGPGLLGPGAPGGPLGPSRYREGKGSHSSVTVPGSALE